MKRARNDEPQRDMKRYRYAHLLHPSRLVKTCPPPPSSAQTVQTTMVPAMPVTSISNGQQMAPPQSSVVAPPQTNVVAPPQTTIMASAGISPPGTGPPQRVPPPNTDAAVKVVKPGPTPEEVESDLLDEALILDRSKDSST